MSAQLEQVYRACLGTLNERSVGLGDHGVLESSDLADLDADGIAWLEVHTGPVPGDAAGGAGRDDVARLQGEGTGQARHLLVDVEQHVREVPVLAPVVVDVGADPQVEGIADLVDGHDLRPDRPVGVERLADDHAGLELLPVRVILAGLAIGSAALLWARPGQAWREFLAAQAHAIIADDFLVVGTMLLKRLSALVFTGPGTRGPHLAGVSARPAGAWAVQQARNLAMDLGDGLCTLRFLIHDRYPLFTTAFGDVFKAEGLPIVTTAPRTPRMNAICERVIGTLRRELLDRTLILGGRHLDLVLREYPTLDNRHRVHQSRRQWPPDIETQLVQDVAPACGLSAGNPSSRK